MKDDELDRDIATQLLALDDYIAAVSKPWRPSALFTCGVGRNRRLTSAG
jgi:hypothetical protein